MTVATPVRPLPITAAGVVSSAGFGFGPLAELLRSGDVHGTEPVGADAAEYPDRPVRPVADFRLADHFGRKGTRYLDRLTGFGLVACQQALGETAGRDDDERREGTGVVMATNTGSVSSHSSLLYETLVQEHPYMINPAQFPNTVMNCCAGQIAIRNGLRGMNATVAGGQASSLFAFRHARVALTLGRAERLLVGGVEELSAPTAWAWHRSGVLKEQAAIGEGCAVFVVEGGDDGEPGAEPPLAELLACEVSYCAPSDDTKVLADGLALCITRALQRSGVEPADVQNVSLGGTNHLRLDHAEEQGVQAVLGTVPGPVRVGDVLGETYSAGGAMQLAALLALWQAEPRTERIGLITSVGHDGNVAAQVVRRG